MVENRVGTRQGNWRKRKSGIGEWEGSGIIADRNFKRVTANIFSIYIPYIYNRAVNCSTKYLKISMVVYNASWILALNIYRGIIDPFRVAKRK